MAIYLNMIIYIGLILVNQEDVSFVDLLYIETIKHIVWNCNKVIICWNMMISHVDINLNHIKSFSLIRSRFNL